MEPRTIGRYRILDKLGEGGMGVVYAAEDTTLRRRVAIKTIHREIADATARERLWREARAAAGVNHPNVCQVFEVGEEAGETFLAMELLEGEPLSARLSRGPLPLAESIDTTLAVLAALEALHARGVVHRDLKPSNVFLTPHGVKLLDFGLALPLEGLAGDDERLTRPGIFVGTPGYMAPEQWLGEEVGPAADLFATGALLLEMVSGLRAFQAEHPAAMLHRVLNEHPPALSGGPSVEAVDRVVQWALAKRAADRPDSAAAFAGELRKVRTRVDGSERPVAVALRRILVVPFRLLREDADIDFLPLGLADALSTSLRGIDGLVVTSSRVGGRYAGDDDLDLARIERETGAELVLAGTILRAGERLRVHAELLRPRDGAVLWTEHTEAGLGDLFRVQDDLARLLVESLALELAPGRRRALQRDVPANPKAYEYFLRANQLSYNFGMLASARDLYRACLEADPAYAPAWARLGRVYRVMGKYGHGDAIADLAAAENAFRRALELNPDLATAHNLYAYYEIEELGRPADALVRLLGQARRAPTDADLWAGLVVACRFCGLLDASLEADVRARRLDPGIRTSVAYSHWMRGDHEAAIASDDEDLGWIHYYALPLLGRGDEAVARCRRREERATHAGERTLLASNRAALEGARDECIEASRAVLASSFHDPEGLYFVARNLVRVGATESGLAALERVTGHGLFLPDTIERDPWLDPVRDAPAYRASIELAREGHRAAERRYLAEGGDRLLGGITPR